MLATQPPSENLLAVRAAVIELARVKLAPLYPEAPSLAALPAWLWSLAAHDIARSLSLDAPFLARDLAIKLEAETDRRHPAERFVSYLSEHHPHLSNVQRARLAEFAHALHEERARSDSAAVTHERMARRGFSEGECERMTRPALTLISAVYLREEADAGDTDTPAEMLRAAGARAHARRAFAEGDLEFDAADAGQAVAR